jgi:hypothetical protein
MNDDDIDHMLYVGGLTLAFKIRERRRYLHKRIHRKLKHLAIVHANQREDQGWKQREIADELGVSVSTLYRWREQLWPYPIRLPKRLRKRAGKQRQHAWEKSVPITKYSTL